ncbi:hypothetical protein OCV67_11940 [Porcipelethomonas ammoniilytica]|uniref:hypothetical protein n=1 Tax=Porcipelethomonas ammoniilytica TaxID=2981722 RepID=UPI0021CE570F|nr:hypothetical protein [Porcipelethomonas ammoniilytica]MCU6720631.1 hypothetical protein [Porcipelethomonas ammoniilytica]
MLVAVTVVSAPSEDIATTVISVSEFASDTLIVPETIPVTMIGSVVNPSIAFPKASIASSITAFSALSATSLAVPIAVCRTAKLSSV